MDYIVGYRGFSIIRKSGESFFRIYRGDKLVSDAKFYRFGDARRECDYLR